MSPASDPPKPTGPSPKKTSGGPPPLPTGSGSGSSRGWLLPLVVVLLLVGVCVLIGLALARRAAQRLATAPEPVVTSLVEPVAPATNAVPVIPATHAAVASNAAPAFRLQGIIYDPVQPRAIVDGQTVHIGSQVGDFRVKEISRNTLVLEGTNGSRKELVLGR